MNETQLKAIIDVYRDPITAGKDVDRFLMTLAKNIEREVRHSCMSIVYNAANQINSLKAPRYCGGQNVDAN